VKKRSEKVKARARERAREWWAKNKERANKLRREKGWTEQRSLSGKTYRAANRDRLVQQNREWAETNIARLMWLSAKRRAKKYNVPFGLAPEDIIIPKVCPALGMPLKRGIGSSHDASPTLDRVIPAAGYVKGNVVVISSLANRIKTNATKEQLERVLRWMKGRT